MIPHFKIALQLIGIYGAVIPSEQRCPLNFGV
jgi:hypothetical protein